MTPEVGVSIGHVHAPAPLPTEVSPAHAAGKSAKSERVAGATSNSVSVVWVVCMCCPKPSARYMESSTLRTKPL